MDQSMYLYTTLKRRKMKEHEEMPFYSLSVSSRLHFDRLSAGARSDMGIVLYLSVECGRVMSESRRERGPSCSFPS